LLQNNGFANIFLFFIEIRNKRYLPVCIRIEIQATNRLSVIVLKQY